MKASSLEILERSQLPPSQARAIFQVMEAELNAREHTLATRTDLRDGLHALELKLGDLRSELKSDIRDTVRWTFAFWVAQLAAMAAILKLIK